MGFRPASKPPLIALERPSCRGGLRHGLLRSDVFMAHNLVLDTLQILEEERIVASGDVFRIFPWWTHYRGAYSLQLGMQPVDLGAR